MAKKRNSINADIFGARITLSFIKISTFTEIFYNDVWFTLFKNANFFIDIPLKIDLRSIELELYFDFKISFSIDIFFLFFTQHSEPDYPEIKRRFPSSTITHIPGAGHWVHSEKPKEFLDIASKFINSW